MSNITSYNFMQYLVNNVAPKYFENVDDHRLGVFGYLNESFGILMDSNVTNTVMQLNNILPITASREYLLKYSFGTGENYNLFATPAKQQYLISIPKSVVITEINKNNEQIDYILNDFSVDLDGLIYNLNNTITITAVNNYDGTFNYSSKLNNDSNVLSPYLLTVTNKIDDEMYIMIRVDLYQIEKKSIKKSILDRDLSLRNIEYSFEDQIYRIEATYKIPGGIEESIPVYNKYSIEEMTIEKHVKYYIDEEFNILHISIDSFDPEYNSELNINILQTKGSVANFKNTTPSVTVLDNDFLVAIPISDSVGGTDVIGTEELRRQIILNASTLESVDTDKDLQIKFDLENTSDLISSRFIKKKDDIITMLYTNYLLFRNITDNQPIPSNTMNMKLVVDVDEDIYDEVSGRRIFYPGTAFSLQSGETRLVEKNTTDIVDDDSISIAELDNTKLLYGLPFLMVITESPDIVGYYINSINKNAITDVEYNNSLVDYQFICNKINIFRDSIISQDYTISTELIWNSILPDGLLDENNDLLDPSKLKPIMYIFDDENNVVSYKPMTIEEYSHLFKTFKCSVTLNTDDYINVDDEIRITDIYNSGSDVLNSQMIYGNNGKFAIAIYVADNQGSVAQYDGIVPNLPGYSITSVYSSEEFVLFRSINNINTNIYLTNDGEHDIINLEEVPLIRYSYLKENISEISNLFSESYDLLFNIGKYINEDIDIKLYNTYGISRYLQNNETEISNVNTRMAVKIIFKDFVSDTYKEKIKIAISEQIDDSGELIISKLYYNLFNSFNFESIEILSIDGISDTHKDILIEDLDLTQGTSTEIVNYVPEKLVIYPDNITIESYVKH